MFNALSPCPGCGSFTFRIEAYRSCTLTSTCMTCNFLVAYHHRQALTFTFVSSR